MSSTLLRPSVILGVILFASLLLHIFLISYPPAPAFDEAHFATYAADYVNHKPFYDIHPPLGKLLFAGVLSLFPHDRVAGAEFLTFPRSQDGKMHVYDLNRPFGNFPYIPLRLFASLWGVALIFFFYRFLIVIGVGQLGALIAALALAFESAFLLETRLILMNGMYLALGFAALWLLFDARKRALWAGIMLGLSLSVKLMGVLFLLPALLGILLLKRNELPPRRFKIFCATGIVVLILMYAAQSLFFSPQESLAALYHDGFIAPSFYSPPLQVAAMSAPAQFLVSTVTQGMLSVANYVTGGDHPYGSAWYFWPMMQVPILYYGEGQREVTLTGNVMVWFGATLAVAGALAVFPRFLKRWRAGIGAEKKMASTALILLGGYLGSLAPFIFMVARGTFLYHYFPAYLFGIGLLGFWIERILTHSWFSVSSMRRRLCMAALVLAILGGFLYHARYVWGLVI